MAPENTLAAIRVGLAHGYRGVEFDAMLSADDTPVLMHDPVFGRTVGGRGKVSDRPASELVKLDAGSWHSAEFAGEKVPTLQQALDFCRDHEIWVNLEIKPTSGHEKRTGMVVANVVSLALQPQLLSRPLRSSRTLSVEGTQREGGDFMSLDQRTPLLSSFSPVALAAARQVQPAIPRGLLVHRVPRDWRKGLEVLGCAALHVDHKYLNADIARAIKDAGYWLFCYTVNTPERALEVRSWGVDAFCTDRIDRIAPDSTGGS